MFVIYRNHNGIYRRSISCTTKGLAEVQLKYNKELGFDVFMLEFKNAFEAPDVAEKPA
jgi:hypothetical protein